MRSKLLTYCLPFIAASTTLGCESSDITIEKAYYHKFNEGAATCLYIPEDKSLFGGLSNPAKDEIALDIYITIRDQDNIKKYSIALNTKEASIKLPKTGENQNYFDAYDLEEIKTATSLVGMPKERDNFLTVEAIDHQGETTRRKFTLDDIIKKSKPFITTNKKDTDYCLKKVE